MDSSELDFCMERRVKQKPSKKKAGAESTGIYDKLRNMIKKAHPTEKQDEGLKLLDKVMNKMELGMPMSDLHKIFLQEGIRGENLSGSDIELNTSNLIASTRGEDRTIVLVEVEPTPTETSQSPEQTVVPEPGVENNTNPFLNSPERIRNTASNIQYTEIDRTNSEQNSQMVLR